MTSVVLSYQTYKGSREYYQVDDRCFEIQLDRKHVREQIVSIDLSPLRGCTRLERLVITHQKLESIDLEPLTKLKHLQEIRLDKNCLLRIDLTPLAKCPGLRYLSFHSNLLERIDLQPLSQCAELRTLDLGENQLVSAILDPLGECQNLKDLNLSGNRLKYVDLLPLRQCSQLSVLSMEYNEITTLDISPLLFCENLEKIESDNRLVLVAHPSLQGLQSIPAVLRKNWSKIQWTETPVVPEIIPAPTVRDVPTQLDRIEKGLSTLSEDMSVGFNEISKKMDTLGGIMISVGLSVEEQREVQSALTTLLSRSDELADTTKRLIHAVENAHLATTMGFEKQEEAYERLESILDIINGKLKTPSTRWEKLKDKAKGGGKELLKEVLALGLQMAVGLLM